MAHVYALPKTWGFGASCASHFSVDRARLLSQVGTSQKVCAVSVSMGLSSARWRLSAASTRLPSGTVPKKYPPAATVQGT